MRRFATFLYNRITQSLNLCIKVNIKEIFHAFLFNIRNYSPEVINIQQHEAELNIILPRVNNFDIKQKKAWNIDYMPPTPSTIWEDLAKHSFLLVMSNKFLYKIHIFTVSAFSQMVVKKPLDRGGLKNSTVLGRV